MKRLKIVLLLGLPVIILGTMIGNGYAVNCTKTCANTGDAFFFPVGTDGTQKCRHFVAGTWCSEKWDLFIETGVVNEECEVKAGSAVGDVKYKSCPSSSCSSDCENQATSDKYEASIDDPDVAGCSSTTSRKQYECVDPTA